MNLMEPQIIQLVNTLILTHLLEIFFEALEKKHYKCFLGPKTDLPMVYIDDCIKGTVSSHLLLFSIKV